MDYQREVSKTKKYIKRTLYIVLPLTFIGATTAALSRLEPAAPMVDEPLWTDIVKRGDMVREVRGSGTLVPVDIRWISPATSGRVEKILIQPGTPVEPDTVIFQLSNPELEMDAEDAKLQMRSAESQISSRRVQLENELLDQQTAAARVEADYIEASLRAKSEEELNKEGLISDLQMQVTKVRAEELAKMKKIENQRVEVQKRFAENQLAVLQTQVDQAKALYNLKLKQVDALYVRAGIKGVLDQRLVEVGQQVTTSTSMAKASDPSRLKAVIKIDQNQARELLLGQPATIDLRSAVVSGKVARIDPVVLEGTVNVDIALEGDLPKGARPDLSFYGTIEIEKLTDVLYVGRPVYGQPNQAASVFKVEADGYTAHRIQVQFGLASVNTIEVAQGLLEGEKIVLSDMSQWDHVNKVRMK